MHEWVSTKSGQTPANYAALRLRRTASTLDRFGMAKRIFEIGAAPESEVEGVRAALRDYGVAFYETPQGNYGRSMAALWVENDADYSKARQVIDQYQATYRATSGADTAKSMLNWKLVPWGILLVMLLVWMMAMGYSR